MLQILEKKIEKCDSREYHKISNQNTIAKFQNSKFLTINKIVMIKGSNIVVQILNYDNFMQTNA
jgi:hypothetical protein